jgi:hypothetical protein
MTFRVQWIAMVAFAVLGAAIGVGVEKLTWREGSTDGVASPSDIEITGSASQANSNPAPVAALPLDEMLENARAFYVAGDHPGMVKVILGWLSSANEDELRALLELKVDPDLGDRQLAEVVHRALRPALVRWAEIDGEGARAWSRDTLELNHFLFAAYSPWLKMDGARALTAVETDSVSLDGFLSKQSRAFVAAHYDNFDLGWAKANGTRLPGFTRAWMLRGTSAEKILAAAEATGSLTAEDVSTVVRTVFYFFEGRKWTAAARRLLDWINNPDIRAMAIEAIGDRAAFSVGNGAIDPVRVLRFVNELGIDPQAIRLNGQKDLIELAAALDPQGTAQFLSEIDPEVTLGLLKKSFTGSIVGHKRRAANWNWFECFPGYSRTGFST